MDTRRIGSLHLSAVGLGCNNFGMRIDAAETERVVHAALDAGVNFFDTAELYGDGKSEEYLGRALRGRRAEAVIATKFGHRRAHPTGGGSPANVRRAVDASLARLGVDVIDLYQLHSPDPATPVAETLGALDDLVREGKVREVGCSNFTVPMLREADGAARAGGARFASVQNEYSLFHREPERGVLQECERGGLAFLPYFPLANGLLTGKYRRGRPVPEGTRIADWHGGRIGKAELDRIEGLVAFAASRGRTILDLAFAWLLAQPTVASVIAGATSPQQVRANAAAGAWTLGPEELAAVDAVVPAGA